LVDKFRYLGSVISFKFLHVFFERPTPKASLWENPLWRGAGVGYNERKLF